jgi:hypothetical protein
VVLCVWCAVTAVRHPPSCQAHRTTLPSTLRINNTNSLKTSVYVPPHLTFNNSALPTQCIYEFLYGSENKLRLFPNTALTAWFLGAFAKLRKATISFVMSVRPCPSAWNNSAHTGRIIMKFDI